MLLKVKALRRVIDSKYNGFKTVNGNDFVKIRTDTISLWIQLMESATKIDTNQHLVDVLTATTKKAPIKFMDMPVYPKILEN